MKIIGIVGGIASGKSTVTSQLAELGATVLDADQLAHRLLDHPEVIEQLVGRWGKQILSPTGTVERAELAQRVFSEDATEERVFLESVLHPRIREQVELALSQMADQGQPAAILDAPLLLEAGWRALCDEIIFVDSTLAQRVSRARGRGWGAEEIALREAAQMPIEEKREAATHIFTNDLTLVELGQQVSAYWQNQVATKQIP